MGEVSWKIMFSGKLNVVFGDNRQTEVFPGRKAQQLCVFAMQAVRKVRNEFLTGAELMESWRIKRFFPEERILEIEKIKA